MGRFAYLQRIFSAYLTSQKSHLTFWHGTPQVNQNFEPGKLGEYYMPFIAKADYAGHFDTNGIPLLDYHGSIGRQYNPIAIAQYGLGNYNLYHRTGDENRKQRFLQIADWLADNLETNRFGLRVWHHHFDWEYRDKLKAPWHSALAQGQGISVLVRAHQETGDMSYLASAAKAYEVFKIDIQNGGVTYTDEDKNVWLEEYIVFPPTHILNGFIWATWGVYDFYLATGESDAMELFTATTRTLRKNLPKYDIGFWSLYEQSGTRLKMIASPFYHHLHIVQLKVLYRLTGATIFNHYADRWQRFQKNRVKKKIALAYKALFKLLYY